MGFTFDLYNNSCNKYCYYPPFPDRENEAQMIDKLVQVHAVSVKPRAQTWHQDPELCANCSGYPGPDSPCLRLQKLGVRWATHPPKPTQPFIQSDHEQVTVFLSKTL